MISHVEDRPRVPKRKHPTAKPNLKIKKSETLYLNSTSEYNPMKTKTPKVLIRGPKGSDPKKIVKFKFTDLKKKKGGTSIKRKKIKKVKKKTKSRSKSKSKERKHEESKVEKDPLVNFFGLKLTKSELEERMKSSAAGSSQIAAIPNKNLKVERSPPSQFTKHHNKGKGPIISLTSLEEAPTKTKFLPSHAFGKATKAERVDLSFENMKQDANSNKSYESSLFNSKELDK